MLNRVYEYVKDKEFRFTVYKNRIHIINDVKEAFKIINDIKDKDTYVLLENDLPDIFNEK